MQQYCFHILQLSNLIERQVHTVTEDEVKAQRRRSNRILYCEDVGSSKKWVEVCGEPDMGDSIEEPNVGEMTQDDDAQEEEEEEDLGLWNLLDGENDDEDEGQEDMYRNQYIKVLQGKDKDKQDTGQTGNLR